MFRPGLPFPEISGMMLIRFIPENVSLPVLYKQKQNPVKSFELPWMTIKQQNESFGLDCTDIFLFFFENIFFYFLKTVIEKCDEDNARYNPEGI